MTKTATDARRLAAPALGAGAALSAMLFASRLPVTLDFILPRRAGWLLFAGAFELLSRSGGRGVFSAVVTVSLLAALARFLWLSAAAARGRVWTAKDLLVRGARLALVFLLLRWSFAIWFEVSQKVWFPFGSMNALEPVANFLACSAIAFAAMLAALRQLGAVPAPLAASLLPWTGANLLVSLVAAGFYGAWWVDRPLGRMIEKRAFYVVLTEEDGRPSQAAYDIPVEGSDRYLADLERFAEHRGTSRLEELRFLYAERAKEMDAPGLRRALLLGVAAGDDLARWLLLGHLAVAPPSREALAALGALADETAHRIGPMGASRLALAYARQGDAEQAGIWAKRAAAGPRGIPGGLLELPVGGALEPGRIAGRVAGIRPARVALYRKSDPAAPYLLDAAGLVSASELDREGRFVFSGLPAGRYYLAFSLAPSDAPRGEIRVSGNRGDLSLDSRRTSLDLSPLTIKLTSR